MMRCEIGAVVDSRVLAGDCDRRDGWEHRYLQIHLRSLDRYQSTCDLSQLLSNGDRFVFSELSDELCQTHELMAFLMLTGIRPGSRYRDLMTPALSRF